MHTSDVTLFLLAALFAVAAALLACVEAALSRVSRVAVDRFERDGRTGAAKLRDVVSDPARHLALLLLLRTACEMATAALVTVAFVHGYGAGFGAVGLGLLVATLVSYVLVGVVFRTLGRQHAPWVALRAAGATQRLTRVFGPLPRLLIALGNAVTPGQGYRDGPFATEAELRDLVDLAEERDVIERGERDMIASVFELRDTLAREVMVPRTEMVVIEHDKTVRQALSLALRSGFSRLPVTGRDMDDVVGIAFLKDLVQRDRDGLAERAVEDVVRIAVFVPDSKPAGDLLREMQASRTHMGIVIDEYGGTAGLVTIEDVLEEIVGEITDEYDDEIAPVDWLDGDTARVIARMPVEDLGELFDVELPNEDEVETVGGLLASALGQVPIPGSSTTVAGLRLTAEGTAGRRNRIGSVLVHRERARRGRHGTNGAAPVVEGRVADDPIAVATRNGEMP